MKKADLSFSFGDRRRLERDRVRSGRDLIRVTKLTREKLDKLREETRSFSGYDELLYMLAVAALRDFELEEVNLALEQQVNLADPSGIHRRPRVGKPARASLPGDRRVNPAAGKRRK